MRPLLSSIGMVRVLSRAAALACACCCGVAAAAPPSAASAPTRAAIQAERQRLEAGFAAEEAQCSGRFAVTACVDDVRQRRRAALAAPRAQELALDDAERQARAAARREAVADKQRRAAERPILPAEPAREPRQAASAPLAPPPVHERLPPSASDAAQRAAAAQLRREKIRAGQQRIEARQAERARKGKPAAPLPVPGAASAAR